MPTKVEVRIRYCCCCSLTIAAILIAIYTIIIYGVFLGLSSWSLSRTINGNIDRSIESCSAGYVYRFGDTTVIVDPYFCTLGWYTEELKFTGVRYPVLVIDIVLFILIIISALLVFVALCVRIPYFLLPWIGFMCLDVVRGTISCILIFVYAHMAPEVIKPIATGIFFLGLQFFHVSLILIMVALFQKMIYKTRGASPYEIEPRSDKSVLVETPTNYPAPPGTLTIPHANLSYSASPRIRRDIYYQQQPNFRTYQPGQIQRAPSDLSPRRLDEYGRPYYSPSSGAPPYPLHHTGSGYNYGSHYFQAANYGKTM